MKLRYETLFLTVPEITADEAKAIESQIDSLVGAGQGTVLSYDRWGKYRLAYPVRKNEYGVYYLVRFEAPEANIQELTKSLHNLFTVKYPDLVMRYTTVRLLPKQSLEYRRPESLEEVPTRDVDAFLKENKMSGLLQNKSFAQNPAESEEIEVSAEEAVA